MFTSTPDHGKAATCSGHYWWVLIIFLCFSTRLTAQTLPSGFLSSPIQSGYDTPVGTVFSANGQQLFVWDKAGRVFVSTWNGTTYIKQSTPVLDISDEVGNWRDFGLLSICLDPNFSQNGLFYLFYVVDRHHLLYYGTPQYNKDANEYFKATISRVTRYRAATANGSLLADRNSRQVLLGESKSTGIPLLYESHAGGTILFGRDGTLMISTGDNASYDAVDVGSDSKTYVQTALNEGIMRPAENVGALRSQMITSLCGKVLRIDPNTGDGIASNPFFNGSDPRAPQSRVWALGLRNPFRMSLQPNTGSTNRQDGNPGTLFVGDVGWYTYEDLQQIDRGGLNCGWPLYEGLDTAPGYYGRNIRNQDEPGQPTFESQCQQPASPTVDSDPARRRLIHSRPILDWRHEAPIARVPAFNGNTPVARNLGTEGAPSGTPFQGNAAMGGVFYTGTQFPSAYQNSYFFADFGQNWIKNIVLHDDHQVEAVRDFAGSGFGQGVVHLEVSPLDGSLYCVNLNGQIIRISYGGNQPPTARLTANVTSGSSPLTVQFSGSSSSDPEGRTLTYRWDFGDGSTSTEVNPQHVFSSSDNRSFTTSLVVTDDGQQTDTKQLVISLNSVAPTARITSPADGSLYPLDKISYYRLEADVTDANRETLAYEWQVWLQHNNHEHPEPVLREASPQVQISPVGCSGTDTYSYRITLKVTNQGGLTASTSVRIFPNCQSGTTAVGQATATPRVNAVQVSWKSPVVAFDEVMVTGRAGAGFQSHPSGTGYTADANYKGNGSAFEDGKVVYRGNGQEVTVQNLDASTPYYFRIYTRIGSTWNEGVEVTATPTGNAQTGGALVMIAPVYTCATGAITFRTTGGTGAPIEYAAGGITGWTTNPNQTVESGLRGDPKVLVLAARQGNVQVSYTFDLPAACGSGSTPGNLIPVVTAPIGDQLLNQQQPYTFTIPGNTFSDPDNQSLTYALTGLPDGLSFDRNSATISGRPTTAGQSTVTLTATDPGNLSASTSFLIRVVAPTSSPGTTPPPTTIPSTSFAITGVTTVSCQTVSPTLRQISFTPQYAGLNGQAVAFSVIGEMVPTTNPGPYTLQIYTDNPTITLKARQSGSEAGFAYNWLAACAGNTGTTSPPPATSNPTNQAPRLANPVADQQSTVNQLYTFTVPGNTFSDPDNQSLTYALTGLPDGLSFDRNSATISGRPTTAGQSTVTLTATDPGNLSASTSFLIRVVAPTSSPGTTPPPTTIPSTSFAITGVTTVSCQTVSPTLRQISFTPQYAGLNGQAVAFSVIGEMVPTTNPGPYTLQIYTDNPTITLKARQSGSEAGFAYSWLAACAGNTGTTSPPPATSNPTNQAPRLANPVADQQSTVNQLYTFTVPGNTFSDPDNQSLTYALTGLPDGLSFDRNSATISGRPTTAGQSTVTLTATDPGNLSASTSFLIRVVAPTSSPGTTPPPTTIPSTSFAITGVTTVSCQTVSPTLRQISFTPQYAGLNGQAVAFSVIGEMVPTTNPGPYTLQIYTDNPTITLKARQSGSEASFAYNWLAACPQSNGRVSAEPVEPLVVKVLGNPVLTDVVSMEIRGAKGQWIRLQLFNERGYVVGDINIRHVDPVEWPSVKLDGPAGLYLLHVSTPTQLRIVKVLKL